MKIREFEGSNWVLFSELLSEAGGLDATTANRYADELGISRVALPGDGRKKYIRTADVPDLLGRYSRPNAAIEALLSSDEFAGISGNNPGNDTPDTWDTPAINPGKLSGVKPGNPGNKPGKLSGVKSGNPGNKPGKLSGVLAAFARINWDETGERWGQFYASPFTAYFALTALIVAQAWLHASGVWRRIPTLPAVEVVILTALMQSAVLIGTVNSRRFFGEKSGSYWWFIGGFALYDVLMGACNFFIGYDPTSLIDAGATWPVKIAAITDLGFRIGFSLGFPAATVFFAALVKKLS